MNLLTTLYRQNDIFLDGTVLFRIAYRAIIKKGTKYLLVQSKKYGEIKFPGGGKEQNESRFDVLRREVEEETGYHIKSFIRPFGKTVEYAKDFLGDFDVFKQESRYYFCSVFDGQSTLNLDDYEIEYGYHPIWVTLEEAIEQNQNVPSNDLIPWKERDTFVFKLLLEMEKSSEN
ncbi:MAG: NUDIX hydrolase [Candidatus Izemoplasmatales bacterium]